MFTKSEQYSSYYSPFHLANVFNTIYVNVGEATFLKALSLAREHNIEIQNIEKTDDANSCALTESNSFNFHAIGEAYLRIKRQAASKSLPKY